jgi:hypothetical protein
MPRRFVLYIPIGCPGGEPLCATVEGILCERLGGVTSYPARGTFKMAAGNRSSDHLQVLESYCESGDWARQYPFLLALTAMVGAILRQESIACAIDGRMEIVPPMEKAETLAMVNPATSGSEEALTDAILHHLASDGENPGAGG